MFLQIPSHYIQAGTWFFSPTPFASCWQTILEDNDTHYGSVGGVKVMIIDSISCCVRILCPGYPSSYCRNNYKIEPSSPGFLYTYEFSNFPRAQPQHTQLTDFLFKIVAYVPGKTLIATSCLASQRQKANGLLRTPILQNWAPTLHLRICNPIIQKLNKVRLPPVPWKLLQRSNRSETVISRYWQMQIRARISMIFRVDTRILISRIQTHQI